MPATITSIEPETAQNDHAAPIGGHIPATTFIPYMPEISVSGMKMVATTVSRFITSLRRLLTAER